MNSMNLNREYLSTWALTPEDMFMRDLGNFLRKNKINFDMLKIFSLIKKNGSYNEENCLFELYKGFVHLKGHLLLEFA